MPCGRHCGAYLSPKRIRLQALFCSPKCYRAANHKRRYKPKTIKGFYKSDGYIAWTFSNHKSIREQRALMEQHIGRELLPDEIVHHDDEIRDNNEIENLKVMTRSEHSRLHYSGQPGAPRRRRLR